MGIDATRKILGEGQVRRWPARLEMADHIKARVARRWAELGLD
jgi:3-polyprenyl-4-hydroxybenzoate decarboxylase